MNIHQKIKQFNESKGHYHAISLDQDEREKLLKHVAPKYPNVHASHITLNFKPSDEDEKHFDTLEGKPVQFDVTHHAHDDKIGAQAVRVGGLGEWHKKKPNTHITISTTPTSKPVKSNDLLATKEGEKTNLKLNGTYRRLPK